MLYAVGRRTWKSRQCARSLCEERRMVLAQHSPPAFGGRMSFVLHSTMEHLSVWRARLAAAPKPGVWQGVWQQGGPEEETLARTQTEMRAELDVESTLNTARTGDREN